MTKTYLITLTPQENFYFGTPKSFEESFYVSSDYLPTQSSLLGMLRYQILKQFDLLNANGLPNTSKNDEITKLTGKIEFDFLQDLLKPKNSKIFGKLLKISPVFICYTYNGSLIPNDFLLPVPNDVLTSKNSISVMTPKYNYTNNKILTFEKNKNFPSEDFGGVLFWQHYIENKNIESHYIFKFNEIFIPLFKYGIQRKDRVTQETKFYIKKYFSLKKGFSFCIIIHSEIEIYDDDVFLGGERSIFKMKVFEIKDELKKLIGLHPIINRFLQEDDFGDFYTNQNSNSSTLKKYILISNSVFDINSFNYKLGYITNLYSFRMFDRKKLKTDTIRMLPLKSVLYSVSTPNFNSVPLIAVLGYNFSIKIEVNL